MSVKAHCDNPDCDLILYELQPSGRSGTGVTVWLQRPDEFRGGASVDPGKREFCDYECLSIWAALKDKAGEVR